MQIGFSKTINETLLEDVFEIILRNIIKHKKVKIAKFGKIKKENSYLREMLYFLKPQKNSNLT